MTANDEATRKYLKEILKKAEIKRVGERLTKKELCNIYGFNYQFYMNAVSDRNVPSHKMAKSLSDYLETPTDTVYRKVFASRKKEDEFHKELKIDKYEAEIFIEMLEGDEIFREPRV